MAINSTRILKKLLQTLVDEYGFDEVSKTLSRVSHAYNSENLHLDERQNVRRSVLKNDIKPRRPTGIDQAKKLLPNVKEPEALLALAAKFDRKEFLPNVSDIRDFLEKMGVASDLVRDRIEGFRQVLIVLTQLPSERIKLLANVISHSGPAQLAPLAAAIRSAGDAMRRSDYTSSSEEETKPSDKPMGEGAPTLSESDEKPSSPPLVAEHRKHSFEEVSSNPAEQPDATSKEGKKPESKGTSKDNPDDTVSARKENGP